VKDDLVSSDVFDHLRVHYSDDQIVALTAAITWELCVAKFNRALEIEAQGICLLPEVK
jgi:alkylhydroperoxidase family enzyme